MQSSRGGSISEREQYVRRRIAELEQSFGIYDGHPELLVLRRELGIPQPSQSAAVTTTTAITEPHEQADNLGCASDDIETTRQAIQTHGATAGLGQNNMDQPIPERPTVPVQREQPTSAPSQLTMNELSPQAAPFAPAAAAAASRPSRAIPIINPETGEQVGQGEGSGEQGRGRGSSRGRGQ